MTSPMTTFRSEQLDIFRDDPARRARAYRIAADAALAQGDNQFFTAQERHDNYTAEAERLEALAGIKRNAA